MIEIVIKDVVARTPPSHGDNLTGFIMDLDHAINQSGLSDDAKIIKSGDDLSILNVPLSLPLTVNTLEKLSSALHGILADIAYTTFHAAAFTYHRDAAALRFVTAVPDSGLRVTGTIIVAGPAYVKVAGRSDRTLTPLPGGLPRWVPPS